MLSDYNNADMKILIIEDELHAKDELCRLLNKAGAEYEVIDWIETVEEAVEWLQDPPKVDLIFMDVQLADGKSFEIFEQVEVPFPIIFTTAYDGYAIEAFKVNSVDYLLKPIGVSYLKAALKKFQIIHQEKEGSPMITKEQLSNLLSGGAYKKRFVVTIGDKILQIPTSDIAYFYAEGDTVFLITEKGKKYIVNHTLEQLNQLLDPVQFFRITRKYIAKISAIKEINKYFHSRLLLTLDPPTSDEVLVSRAKVSDFLKWMDG